jgi:site-specific recombinase XerD
VTDQVLSARPGSYDRHIGAHHFAFLRGWIQGLPLHGIGQRYLESGLDLRVIKSELRWLRTAVIAMAARSPRPELAALLRRSARSQSDVGATGTAGLPTLEEFAQRFPDGFYSEAELNDLFSEAFTDHLSPAERRRIRLVVRQLDALRYLEPRATVPPQLTDGVAAWFAPSLTDRLTRAGLRTLAHIHDSYHVRGKRWWTQVPRLGAKGAEGIERWWQQVASLTALEQFRRTTTPGSPGMALRASAHLTELTVVMPIEHLRVPSSLSGATGDNRQRTDRCKLSANDDYAAIYAWLSTRPTGSATWRSYRKEAERFLLWAIVERQKAFSSLTTEDCIAYRDFLIDPQPCFRWIGPSATPRWSSQWRPFCGPLSWSSAQHAQTVLRLLCEWLTRQRYLDTNPWDGVPIMGPNRIRLQVGRSFTLAQWSLIRQRLSALPPSSAHHRLQFIVPFLYATGLRLNDLATARIGQLEFDLDTEGWSLHVVGKGLLAREVPLASDTVTLLQNYVTHCYPDAHLNVDPSLEGLLERLSPDTALLRSADLQRNPTQLLSGSTVYKSLKDFFTDIANGPDVASERDRKRFASASTHWLRHTFASHAVADGMSLDVVRDVLGHASIATTSIYVSAEKKRRVAQMERLVEIRKRNGAASADEDHPQ